MDFVAASLQFTNQLDAQLTGAAENYGAFGHRNKKDTGKLKAKSKTIEKTLREESKFPCVVESMVELHRHDEAGAFRAAGGYLSQEEGIIPLKFDCSAWVSWLFDQ